MGRIYDELEEPLQQFIRQQKMFFVATATAEGRINLSPKGLDTFRILDSQRVAWLNLTGSGNETAAHLQTHPRMTIMFNAFEGKPMILRLYGQAKVIHQGDVEWETAAGLFPDMAGTRQIIEMQIESVQTSCGMAVPLYEYQGQRDELVQWA